VEKLTAFAQRNGKRRVHVHAANWIAYQPACRSRSRNPVRGLRRLRRRSPAIPEHTANDAAQEPHAPRNDEQPKQKSNDTSEKVHLDYCVLNGLFCLMAPEAP